MEGFVSFFVTRESNLMILLKIHTAHPCLFIKLKLIVYPRMGGSRGFHAQKKVSATRAKRRFLPTCRAPSPSLSMTRADASSYKSMVSENTPLLERGAGSWWDRHRTPLVASSP